MKKALLLLEFYKNIVPVIIALSLLSLLFLPFIVFVFVFVFFSFFISLVIFEVNNKREYVFYYNNGITKYQLWGFSFVYNCLIFILFLLFWNLIL